MGSYQNIFFSKIETVNFGESVFENSFHPPYNISNGEVNNVYVTIYPNWKFNGKNVFKNTESSIWMNTVELDGFSWTKNNFAIDCFGELKTESGRPNTNGWNGILAWYNKNQSGNKFDVNKMPQNAKDILSRIYPSNLYKLGVNGFKYSSPFGGTIKNIGFTFKK